MAFIISILFNFCSLYIMYNEKNLQVDECLGNNNMNRYTMTMSIQPVTWLLDIRRSNILAFDLCFFQKITLIFFEKENINENHLDVIIIIRNHVILMVLMMLILMQMGLLMLLLLMM